MCVCVCEVAGWVSDVCMWVGGVACGVYCVCGWGGCVDGWGGVVCVCAENVISSRSVSRFLFGGFWIDLGSRFGSQMVTKTDPK